MSLSRQQVDAALASLRNMLRADGYELQTVAVSPEGVTLQITAGEDACADCLVPVSLMTLYVRDALRHLPDGEQVPIELRYQHAHDQSV